MKAIMIQSFNDNSSIMEAETIQKNAARPKSRRSRGNMVKSEYKQLMNGQRGEKQHG
jgi:hypothetical protein